MCEHGHDLGEVLLELTYNQLLSQTKTGPVIGKTPRNQESNKVQVQEMNLIPSMKEKTLLVKARTRGKDKFYQTLIVFSGVSFFNEGGHGRQEIQVSDGSTYFIDPIRPYKSNVKVRCECLDFYFRFSVWDKRDQALTGADPKPYHRRTDNYPPVNPSKISGVCKHIMKVVQQLKAGRIIR